MTLSFSSPITNPSAHHTSAGRIRPFLNILKGGFDRIGLPGRLDRMSDHQLRDAGMHRSDCVWLRSHGTSEDTATRLAIRAGMRAGNW